MDDDISKPSITLSLQGKITSDLLSRSQLYAVVAAGSSDTDCSSVTLGKLSDQEKSVIPFPGNTAVRQSDLEVTFRPGLTAAKLCWVERIQISPTLPALEITHYLGFIPPPSAARPLPVRDSRCFLSPADAPCELKLFPKLIDRAANPDLMVSLVSWFELVCCRVSVRLFCDRRLFFFAGPECTWKFQLHLSLPSD